ncbi:hypothetical protein Bca101_035653 [Brassica carinata]
MNYNSLCYVQGNGSWVPLDDRVRRQEGLGLYGAPYGGVAVFSGSVVRGEERLIEAAVGSLILKVSKLFRLLISHLKRLMNVGGVGSMVDGSHESTQIVFDVCLVLSVWDTVHLC